MPSQKNLVSGETTGRITAPASGAVALGGLAGGTLACGSVLASRPSPAAGGRNFRIRKSIVATISPPLYQVLRVVKNQPSPRAVCLGPIRSARLTRRLSRSPSRTYRRDTWSAVVATPDV